MDRMVARGEAEARSSKGQSWSSLVVVRAEDADPIFFSTSFFFVVGFATAPSELPFKMTVGSYHRFGMAVQPCLR
jgi:hypothetical protein